MFTDMVGYTAASQADESDAIQRVRELDSLLQPILHESGGRKIKSTGDGILAEFDSALKATQCAIEIQRQLHERNARTSRAPLQLRVGVHLGDVEQLGSDILGDAVNIAARIEPLADAGGVCISGEVYAQVRNKSHTIWEPVAAPELKGISHPVSVYRASLPWKVTPPSVTAVDPRRIAVLPFANFSPDAQDEYFADGLTEELITVLAKIEGLRVIARTSVFGYKGTTKSMTQIGSELGVASILEGSVRKAGDRIRVTAQLIDVSSQVHRWAEGYDRRLEDVFAVQTDVAREVAKALQMRLGQSDEHRLTEGQPVGTESYLAYLRGRAAIAHSYSEPKLREAQWQLERAIALDPTNARACAALSEATHLLGLFHRKATRQQTDTAARELADRAIRLEPNLADGHSALGLLLYDSLEWAEAEREAQLALSLNPGFSSVRMWYSMLLQEEGRGDEAHREMTLAFESDPQSRMATALLTQLRVWLRRLDEVEKPLQRLRELDSAGRAYHLTAAIYCAVKGDLEMARREAEEGERCPADDAFEGPTPTRAFILALSGRPEEARDLLKNMETRASQSGIEESVAFAYGILGDLDDSFRLLQQKLDRSGNLSLQALQMDPWMEALRKDPRFGEIRKRVRLAP
jgi:adenylate cyclase